MKGQTNGIRNDPDCQTKAPANWERRLAKNPLCPSLRVKSPLANSSSDIWKLWRGEPLLICLMLVPVHQSVYIVSQQYGESHGGVRVRVRVE